MRRTALNESRLRGIKPEFAVKVKKLIDAFEARYPESIVIACGNRSLKEQAVLYSKGRTVKGTIVTRAKPGWSYHNYGVAVDMYPTRNKELAVDLLDELGAMAKDFGITWGGTWSTFIDYPHFQDADFPTIESVRKNLAPIEE